MKYLSQRDPQWCNVKIGQSNSILGKVGCTTTCLSMLSDYFGCYKSPAEIAHNVANYVGDLVNWKALNFECMQGQRLYGRSDVTIQNAINDPNKAIMLNVNSGAHWVAALRKTLFGNSYIVADPWTGKECDVIKTYHDIVGGAVFNRK